mmetsp:Transcript_81956/g.222525  ORF Transcript_81956/g.222525 Transcript_81956/m.222525 type:complete len:307 (-) Transcript_81956:626-1546(-)
MFRDLEVPSPDRLFETAQSGLCRINLLRLVPWETPRFLPTPSRDLFDERRAVGRLHVREAPFDLVTLHPVLHLKLNEHLLQVTPLTLRPLRRIGYGGVTGREETWALRVVQPLPCLECPTELPKVHGEATADPVMCREGHGHGSQEVAFGNGLIGEHRGHCEADLGDEGLVGVLIATDVLDGSHHYDVIRHGICELLVDARGEDDVVKVHLGEVAIDLAPIGRLADAAAAPLAAHVPCRACPLRAALRGVVFITESEHAAVARRLHGAAAAAASAADFGFRRSICSSALLQRNNVGLKSQALLLLH